MRKVTAPPSLIWTSCLTTSATLRSRRVVPAVFTAVAAASPHDLVLVPISSVTLYTLMTFLSVAPTRQSEGNPPSPQAASCPGEKHLKPTTNRIDRLGKHITTQD